MDTSDITIDVSCHGIAEGITSGLLGGSLIIGAAIIVAQLIAVWGVRRNLNRSNLAMNLKKLIKSKTAAGLSAIILVVASIGLLSSSNSGCDCEDCQCCAGCSDTGSCDCDECKCCDNCNSTNNPACCPGCSR